MIKKLIPGICAGIFLLLICPLNTFAADEMKVILSGAGDELFLSVNPGENTDLCLYSYDGGSTFVSQSFIEISKLQLNSEGNIELTVIAKDVQGKEYRAFVCVEGDMIESMRSNTLNPVGDDSIPYEDVKVVVKEDACEETAMLPPETQEFAPNENGIVICYVLAGLLIITAFYVWVMCPAVYCIEPGKHKRYKGRAFVIPGDSGTYIYVEEHITLSAESNHLLLKFSYFSLAFLKYKFVKISAGNGTLESYVQRELYVDFCET